MLEFFPSTNNIDIFKKPSFNIFLSNSPIEFLSFGSEKKLNLPISNGGRIVGNFLLYSQDFLISKFLKSSNFSKKNILGDAHELLHILQNYQLIKNRYGGDLPFLFSEGLNVICGNQLSKNLAKNLFLKKIYF